MNFCRLLLLGSTGFASFIGIGAAALVNNLVAVTKPNDELPFTTERNAMVIKNNMRCYSINYFWSTYDEDGQVKYWEKNLDHGGSTWDWMWQWVAGHWNTQHTIEFNFSINCISRLTSYKPSKLLNQ